MIILVLVLIIVSIGIASPENVVATTGTKNLDPDSAASLTMSIAEPIHSLPMTMKAGAGLPGMPMDKLASEP